MGFFLFLVQLPAQPVNVYISCSVPNSRMPQFIREGELGRLLAEVASTAMGQMPPPTRFGDRDAQVLVRYRPLLESLTEDIVKGFYDVLFSHGPTAAVFQPGERPLREKALRDWWTRTLSGPFNDDYWLWQAYVGIIHFRRKVTPPMFIGMWGWIIDTVVRRLKAEPELVSALVKLGVTQSSLMVSGYYGIVEYALGKDLIWNLVSAIIEKLAAGNG